MSTATKKETIVVTSAGRKVEVGVEALRVAGWIRESEVDLEPEVFCEQRHCDHDEDALQQVIERWHDDNHAGVWRFCYEQPCRDLREVLG